MTPSSARLVAVAAHGLAGSRTDLPAAPLSEIEWFDLVQGCVAADLVGFLAAAVADGHLPVSAGQADELAVLETEHTGLSLLVERRALTMASLLAAAGIDYRIVDGPARRLAYGDAAVRQFPAVQVLVPPGRLHDALGLQGTPPAGVGGRPVQRRERLALRSSVAGVSEVKGSPWSTRGHDAAGPADVAELDLVAHLGPPAVIELAGRTVSVLTLEQQLVLACVEMTAAPVMSLVHLRDVAQLALAGGLDSTRTRRLADATQVTDALADGLALAWSRFDLADKTDLSVWALRMGGSRSDRSAVRRAVAPAGRAGLAQRVFGRLQPVPPGPEPATPLPTAPSHLSTVSPMTARPNGPGRTHRLPRS